MYYFIVNEYGKSKEAVFKWQKLRGEMIAQGIPHKAFLTKRPGHGRLLAERISKGFDRDINIIIVGGDGTINEVINGISDFSRVNVGLIPLGSANDFALGVGTPLDPKMAFERIVNCKTPRKIDLGRVRYNGDMEKLFAISSGIGLDAEICKYVDSTGMKNAMNILGLGNKSYTVATFISFITMKQVKVKIKLDDTETIDYDSVVFLAGMNMPAEGGQIQMAPKAKFDDGKLTFCCGHDVSKLQAPFSMLKLMKAEHENRPEFKMDNFKRMKVISAKPLALHTDGEYCGHITNAVMECMPGHMSYLL